MASQWRCPQTLSDPHIPGPHAVRGGSAILSQLRLQMATENRHAAGRDMHKLMRQFTRSPSRGSVGHPTYRDRAGAETCSGNVFGKHLPETFSGKMGCDGPAARTGNRYPRSITRRRQPLARRPGESNVGYPTEAPDADLYTLTRVARMNHSSSLPGDFSVPGDFSSRSWRAKTSKSCNPASGRMPRVSQSAIGYFYRFPIVTTAHFVPTWNTSACQIIWSCTRRGEDWNLPIS